VDREASQKEREYLRNLDRLRRLRPIDDDFMRCLFRDNKPLVEFVLRILIGNPTLVVTAFETQKDLRRLAGARSVCLDAYATDADGRKYDVEIERSAHRAGARRARYISAAIDIENLDAGEDFEALPQTYTIFITEHDVMGRGQPAYPVERMVLDAMEPFGDEAHILYINGEYRGDGPIGRLMHDFNCSDPSQMHFPLMRQATRYYKETPEGVRQMCTIFEEIKREGYEQGMEKGMQQGMQQGMEKGMEKGMQQGRDEQAQAVYERLLALNMPEAQARAVAFG